MNTNVALAANGATASASSSFSSSYPASAVIDGDRKAKGWGEGAGWMDGTQNNYPDWIQVNFNGSKAINEIDVFKLQDNYEDGLEPTEEMTFSLYGIVDFQVQYWTGSSWQTVSGGSVSANNKVWKKLTFSQITTDKIRVNVTGALAGYSRVTEIEAWGMVAGTSNYNYDSTGSATNDVAHTYEYDSENRIVNVDGGSTASYAYDHQNRRYKKTIGSAVTHYVWQGSKVLAEHNGSTGAVLIDYIYSGSRMIAKVESGATQYLLRDRLSTRLVLDSSGIVSGRQGTLPFGEDFGESGTQEKHHFTSYERDSESGLDYAVNRSHAATLGRFQSADPYRASGYMVDPQSWNRYTYARNEPINRTDRIGLQDEDLGPCWRDGNGVLNCPGVGGTVSINGTINSGRGGASGAGSGADQIVAEDSGLNESEITGGQFQIPAYDDARRECDEALASTFGGQGAVAAGNEFEPSGMSDGANRYRGTLDGSTPGHLTNRMHLYGSADGTQDTTIFVPANYDQVTVLGPGTIAFHYRQLGTRRNVLLVVMHVANYSLGPIVNGRRSIGQTGGPGNDDSTNYRHAHFELFPGRSYPTTEAARSGIRIPFADVFCS